MKSIAFLIVVQIVLIALNAVFAASELAVLSVSEARLEQLAQQGDKRAKRLLKLTVNPAKFLSVIQIAITLSGFLGSAFAADGFSEPLVNWLISLGVSISEDTLEMIAVVLITLVLSYFTLIFGELVPKRIAIKKSEQLALAVSPMIYGISFLFKPIVSLLSVSTNLVLRLVGIDPNEEEEAAGEDEIRMMADQGRAKGTIDKEEQEFIQNIFEFDDITAGEAATHRKDVVFLWLEDSDSEWDRIIRDNPFGCYPVCRETSDDIVGILNARDYFRLEERTRSNVMAVLKPAFFVPENVKADILFRSMKQKRQKMAVAVDEYGGVIGIVTMSDLVEILVGELDDCAEKPHIEQLDENRWNVIGNVNLSDIENAVKTVFDVDDDIETISGFVFNKLGEIPDDGEKNIQIEAEGLKFEITKIFEHMVAECKIVKVDCLN